MDGYLITVFDRGRERIQVFINTSFACLNKTEILRPHRDPCHEISNQGIKCIIADADDKHQVIINGEVFGDARDDFLSTLMIDEAKETIKVMPHARSHHNFDMIRVRSDFRNYY
jgi:hypothetical protein